MSRPVFDLSAYGKPRPRPPQLLDSIVKACAPAIPDSKDLKTSEPHVVCDNGLKIANDSGKIDLALSPDFTQEVTPPTLALIAVTEPDTRTSTGELPKNELADTLITDNPNPATLSPETHGPTTPLPTGSFPAVAIRNPNQKAHPKSLAATNSSPPSAITIESAPKVDNLKADSLAKSCESQRSERLGLQKIALPKSQKSQLNNGTVFMSSQRQSNHAATKNDRLRQLQADSLHQISRKAAVEKIKPANASVSIRDLDLARRPVDPQNPQRSFRRWAQESPLYTGGYGEENAVVFSLQKELSILPQVPSTRADHAQFEPSTSATLDDTRRSKWAIKDEMKAEKVEADSNEWGSQIPSDETRGSNVSDESLGKLLRRREPAIDEPLRDWQGNMMPPPADWAERPRYNNNNPDFKVQFKSYVGELQGRYGNSDWNKEVEHSNLSDAQNIPDGISMVPRTHVIDISNADHYGYQLKDNRELYEAMIKYAQPAHDEEFELVTKLDRRDQGNQGHDADETTETLVTNWNKHLVNARGEAVQLGTLHARLYTSNDSHGTDQLITASIEQEVCTAVSEDEDGGEAAPLVVPELNIYLRPATVADLSELARIYNWYVANGSQPAELRGIDEAAMQSRLQFCGDSKLPFIVAALKSQKNARRVPFANDEEVSRRRQLPVTHRKPVTLTRIEQLAGFCCANDFSQPDFIEHIATDIEIYVDAQFRRMGVGKSLIDKMLHICDRGHKLTMNVPFHCDSEVRHLYEAGGNRELHKMIIILRKWHTPRPFAIDVNAKRKSRKLPLAKTEENDYNRWMKAWFESLGFEEEGYLKKMGAKKGRYIDIVYLARATCWEPAEGEVPDPPQEFLNAYEYDENGEDT